MMQMCKDNVLLKKEAQDKFSNGLWHPDSEIIAQRGTVLLVGPDVKELKEGDSVIYQKFKEKSDYNGHVIISEEFVIATV